MARWHHLSHGRAQMSFWEHTLYSDSGEAGEKRMPAREPGTGHCPHLVMGRSLTLPRWHRNFLCSRELAISWSVFLVTSGMRCFSKSNTDVLVKGQCRAMQLLPALVSWRKVPGTCKFLVFLPGTLLSLGQRRVCSKAVCSLRDVRLAGVPPEEVCVRVTAHQASPACSRGLSGLGCILSDKLLHF